MKRRIFALLSFALVALLASCRKPSGPHIVGAGVIPNPLNVGQLNTQLVSMPQASVAGQPPSTIVAGQNAQTGSGNAGGPVVLAAGQKDGAGASTIVPIIFGIATGPLSNANIFNGNFFALGQFGETAGGVAVMGMCGGTNGLGAGCTAAEIAAEGPISIATEAPTVGIGTPISFAPKNGFQGIQSQTFVFSSAGDNLPYWTFNGGAATASFLAAKSGILAMPWGDSNENQQILTQSNATNTEDLPVISRVSNVLTFGSGTENDAFASASTATCSIANATGNGLVVSSPLNVPASASFNVDTHSTWVEGNVWPCVNDCWAAQLYTADTTATTANQTIATIPITSGSQAVTQLHAKLEAREVSTGDFATFTEDWSYVNNSGTIAAPTGSQPTWTDNGHSTGAGTSIAPAFSVSGANILVKVTPWTTSAVHWRLRIEHDVDMGAAAAPSRPSGAGIVLDASVQGLGAVNTWSDQSGNGNNLTLRGGATAPTNTANAGPGGNTNAVLFTSGTWMGLADLSNAVVGAKNFTIGIVGKLTSTSTNSTFVLVGNTNLNGFQLGSNLNADNARAFNFPGLTGSSSPPGPNQISDGPSTTNWEIWVASSDANGNLSLSVNGVPKPLSTANSVAITPSTFFNVGSDTQGGSQLGGGIAEIDAWNTVQNNLAVYQYLHVKWGL